MNTIRIINTKGGIMAKQFETIQWCIKAVTGDDTRTALKHLYIDNDFMAGCDGHRLHIALNDWDFEPGLYEILNLKANEILVDVKVLQVLPVVIIPSDCLYAPLEGFKLLCHMTILGVDDSYRIHDYWTSFVVSQE